MSETVMNIFVILNLIAWVAIFFLSNYTFKAKYKAGYLTGVNDAISVTRDYETREQRMNNNDESPYVRRYFACGVSNDYTRADDRFSESEDIRADYVNAGPEHGHYFDPDTLAFFGSKHFRTYGRGMSIEYQANAPQGVGRYRVQAWRVADDGAPEPWYGHTHKTKDQAQKCAFVTRRMILSNGATTDRQPDLDLGIK